jgi:hypothetical protein
MLDRQKRSLRDGRKRPRERWRSGVRAETESCRSLARASSSDVDVGLREIVAPEQERLAARTPALYVALDPMTAIKEAAQGFARKFEPLSSAATTISSIFAPRPAGGPPASPRTTWPAHGLPKRRRTMSRRLRGSPSGSSRMAQPA